MRRRRGRDEAALAGSGSSRPLEGPKVRMRLEDEVRRQRQRRWSPDFGALEVVSPTYIPGRNRTACSR